MQYGTHNFSGNFLWLRKFIFLTLLFSTQFIIAQPYRIELGSFKAGDPVLENTIESSRYLFSFEGLHVLDVKTEKGIFSQLILPRGHYVGEAGTPMLPASHQLLEIPYGAEVELLVHGYHMEEFTLSDFDIQHPLMPVQPSLRKNQEAEEVPFSYEPNHYAKSSYIEPELASIEILGSMRGIRIARLTIAPVSYNPDSGSIRVYNNIELEVRYKDADPATMAYKKASVYSPYFDVIHSRLLSSFSDHEVNKFYNDLPRTPIRMLVISTPDFAETLQPFIRWQTERGFEVIERYTNLIGSSSSAIRSFISGEYHSATPERPAPTFLVIAGDVDRIPASTIGSATGEVTDLYYAAVEGGFFPDMYYGRLSARNQQELKNQLDKIIYYQKYQFDDPSYLNDVTLIAGSDVFWNQLILQPTVKYGAQNYFTAANGFANVNLFLSTYEGVYDPARTSVSLINYTAHCTPTSWSGPRLNAQDIHQLGNIGKYPLVIGNCCESALFSLPESIGEAWVRAENRGAVAYIGSAPDTHWFEDFYWSVGAFPMVSNNAGYVPTTQETTMGAYDAPFHHDYFPVGALQVVGNLAITEAHIRGYQSHSNTLWYWQAYHTLGDPSTMIYFTEAEENDIEHYPVFALGSQSFSIKALPGSYVAISKDGVLIGAGFVNENGMIEIPSTQVQSEGSLRIVVTKSQYQTYIRDIEAVSLTGPYVVYETYSINDSQGNNNQQADYGETISLHIDLRNIGVSAVSQVYAWLVTDDPYVELIDADTPVIFSGMSTEAGKTLASVENAFLLHINETTPNNHRVRFTLRISDGEHEWMSDFSITISAPVFWIDPEYVINDSYAGNNNNRLDPGETISLGFRVYNQGDAQSARTLTRLQASSPYLTYDINEINLSSLNPGEMRMASFTVHAHPGAQGGTTVPLELMVSDGHEKSMETSLTIGQPPQVLIGNKKMASMQFPFYNLYKANRTQIIYLGNELGPGGKTINRIGFEITDVSNTQRNFSNFTIRIRHLDFSQFSNAFHSMQDAPVVYYASEYHMPAATGWHYWDISHFEYDGNRNIIIEISWGQNTTWTTPFYRVASTELDRNRVAYGFSDQHNIAPFSGVSNIRPNIHLGFHTPPSLPSYSVNFLVKDGSGQPIESAGVRIGSKTNHVNTAGMTNFSLYPGTYAYEVFTPGSLSSINNNFSITSAPRSFTANFYDVIFNLKDVKSNELINDASITLNGHTFNPGKYHINQLPPGQYQFSISRIGFIDLLGVFSLMNHNLEMNLMMVPDTTVSSPGLQADFHDKLSVYPNPARGSVHLLLPVLTGEANIQFINYQGRVVKQLTVNAYSTEETVRVDISGLSPGVYFISARQAGVSQTEKLIVY